MCCVFGDTHLQLIFALPIWDWLWQGRTVTKTVYTAVKEVGNVIGYVAEGAVKVVGSLLKTGFKIAKGVATSLYNGGMAVGRAVGGFFSSVGNWLFGRRRRRQARDAGTKDSTSDMANSTSHHETHQEQVLQDMARMASAALNLYDASDALYFNGSKGIPVDLGMLSHPEVAARYANNLGEKPAAAEAQAAILAESLTNLQAHAMRKVDLDSQIQTTAYMTDTVGRCLLDGDCDLQDQVDRYDLALQLMTSRRNEAVFSILEDMTDMSTAFQFENAAPDALSLDLPDSPSAADLSQQLAEFDAARAVAKAVRSQDLAASTARVQYTVSAHAHPVEFASLLSSGFMYIAIPTPPASTKYRDVRLAGGVYAHIYPATPTSSHAQGVASIKIQKGSYSTFVPVDSEAPPATYFHANAGQNPVYSFAYNTDTCVPMPGFEPAAPAPGVFQSKIDGVYGEWRVELAEGARNMFTRATHLRLTFDVRWYEDSTGLSETERSRNASNSMFGGDGCDQGAVCFVGQGVPLVVEEDCSAQDFLATAGPGTATIKLTDASDSGGVIIGVLLALALCTLLAVFAQQRRAAVYQMDADSSKEDSTELRPIHNTMVGGKATNTITSTTVTTTTTPAVASDDWLAESVLDDFASMHPGTESGHNASGAVAKGRHSTAIDLELFGAQWSGSNADNILAAHSVGAMSRPLTERLLQDNGMLAGDFVFRESKSKTVLSIVNATGEVVHNAIRPGAPKSGEFIINGKTNVAADTLAAVLQQWLAAPHSAENLLGSKLILHKHWDAPQKHWGATDTPTVQSSRLAVNPEYHQMDAAMNSSRPAIANPVYASNGGVVTTGRGSDYFLASATPSAHHDSVEGSVSPQALYDMASTSHTYEAFYEMASKSHILTSLPFFKWCQKITS